VRHVWGRWLREWVPELGHRRKWTNITRDFQVGDVVLMIDTDIPRRQWNMGRIEETYAGRDGHVRTVKIKIRGTFYIRAITKLCHLELCTK